jgi:hypothetical protein
LTIEGGISREELKKLGKFLVKLFKDKPDLVRMFIEEGCEDMTKEECAVFLASMFAKNKCYTGFIEKNG